MQINTLCVSFLLVIFFKKRKVSSFESITNRIYSLICIQSPCFKALLEMQSGVLNIRINDLKNNQFHRKSASIIICK